MAIAAMVMGVAAGGKAHAESATNRILMGQQTTVKDNCILMKISFNVRIRYDSHFPLDGGNEVRISIRPIDPGPAVAEMLTRRESLRPPDAKLVPVKAIDFEAARIDKPTLTIQFLRPVTYQIGPGADFESIVIAISNPRSGRACKPVYPIGAGGPWHTAVAREPGATASDPSRPAVAVTPAPLPTHSHRRAPGPITPADLKAAAAAMDEARAALRKSDYARAARLLITVLQKAENPHSAEAQELLGIAYQKNKQLAEARAEYEDYLRRYPSGDGAESVRQRLAAIDTAHVTREVKLRSGKGSKRENDGQTSWVVSGSLSQFYIRDDSFRIVRDPSLPPIVNGDKEDHRVHRNALLTSLDLFAAWGSDQYKSKFRFSGTEEHRFADDGPEIVGVSALYYETAIKDWGAFGRIGRQTRNSGGVLGRFDGALASWQATPWLRWNVVGGSPVASRRDEPFKDGKIFYGTSVDIGSLFAGLDVSLFAVQQHVDGMIDRQAIGTEMRYVDATKSAFLTLDYDVHFAALNAAVFNATWKLPDKSTLHGGIDYRRAPYLTAWNALQGQPALTLFDLLKLHSRSEIMQMALDRSTTYAAFNLGYSFPLSEKLQVNLDATATHLDGTIGSFGVDALPSAGTEFYYAAQLMASNVLRDGDIHMAGLRFADRKDSYMYTLDLGTRFPLTPEWRINPRLLLSYREGKASDLTEYTVLPTILFNYYMGKDLSFELEVGARRTWHEQAGVQDTNTELFFMLGFRYDFQLDGKERCPSIALGCR